MRMVSSFYLATAIILSPFPALVSGLIFPRRASLREIAFHEPIAPVQVPLYHLRKRSRFSPTLNPRYQTGPSNSHTNGTSTLLDKPLQTFNSSRTSTESVSQNVTFVNGLSYYLPVTIGGQELNLIIDTGSSDTWTVPPLFDCIPIPVYGDPMPSASRACGFGPEFNQSESPSFQYLNTTNGSFAVGYADNSYAKGLVGQDIVNISGILVNQTIGLANIARWKGDNVTSGILGLGYPGSIPSAPGHRPYDWIPKPAGSIRNPLVKSDIDIDDDIDFDCHAAYPSFVESMAAQGHNPLFSVNLVETRSDFGGHGDRPQAGGTISFGGIPHVKHLGLPFAKAKMNPRFNESTCASDIRQIGYEFEIDAVLDGDTIIYGTKSTAKIDTGASVMAFPPWLYEEFLRRVYPAPLPYMTFISGRLWKISCNATMPDLGFDIGGVAIKLDRNQLIKKSVPDFDNAIPDSEEMCSMNIITNEWSDEVILGIPFLHGALAVYDLENKEIRIAKKFSSDPFHIPTWSDKVSSAGFVDHPPLGGNTTDMYKHWGEDQVQAHTGTEPITTTLIRVISTNSKESTPTPALTTL
ncbi:hypothetical protein TWF506_001044 [Arthrobotrys conoides]|uniref:Peptidase A1 domain-containing protein n=1 Tax=Arthrobotrys conoides TaxID=74498 RepID=A0AAN8RY49_9PEZI